LTRVRRSLPAVAAGIGVAAAFAAYRLWQGLTGVPLVWQDSAGYQQSSLWAGVRPPVVPVFWGLTGTPRSYVVTQTLISIVAWCFLAWTVAMLARPGWARVVAGSIVLTFASTMPLVIWDRSVLSESLSLSALALVFATAIRATQRVTWPRVAALVAASAALALVRDSLIWMVVGLALATAIYAIIHRAGREVLALAFLLLAVSGFAIAGQAAANRNIDVIAHVLFVRIFPYPDRVHWFADHGMPNEAEVLAFAHATKAHRGEAKVVWVAPNDATVQPLVRWLRGDATAVYLEWLALHPGYVLTEPLREPERAFNNAGHLAFYAAADRTDLPIVNTVFDPGAWVVFAVAVIAVIVGVIRGARRERWWRIVVLLGGLGVIEILGAWHGDGMETTRHGVVGNVSVRLAVLVLVVAGSLAPRSRSATQPASDRERGCPEFRGTWVTARLLRPDPTR
jgi:hypothetical protein